MDQIPLSELAKIPYLDVPNLAERAIASLNFFADGDWHLWLKTEAGLLRIKAWPGEGFYFAAEPQSGRDGYLRFLDFIAQRGNLRGVARPLEGIMDDVFNLGACLKKFDILLDYAEGGRSGASRLVLTELEYLFSLCRSVFDLLQEVIAAQWDSVQLLDAETKKRKLPQSFGDMVLTANQLRPVEEIASKFRIPQSLAEFYGRAGAFFLILRTFRDKYVHGGNSPDLVFVTARGFAVRGAAAPFNSFNVWSQEHRLPNDLCSLRPALAYLVTETLRACEDYATTIQQIIGFPPPICPGLRFFMRSDFVEPLLANERILRECSWWRDTPPVETPQASGKL
ncbi:hypothetical protein [Burkholderia gladioli]|uniref:hypothetical protein n=1 Tax=Burkholderia gladioli TaxID=28095 RepID=UPI0016413AB0|nr:hypothetical protein [Burkholderia gladioli]